MSFEFRALSLGSAQFGLRAHLCKAAHFRLAKLRGERLCKCSRTQTCNAPADRPAFVRRPNTRPHTPSNLFGPSLVVKHFLQKGLQSVSTQKLQQCYFHARAKRTQTGPAAVGAFRTCNGLR